MILPILDFSLIVIMMKINHKEDKFNTLNLGYMRLLDDVLKYINYKTTTFASIGIDGEVRDGYVAGPIHRHP